MKLMGLFTKNRRWLLFFDDISQALQISRFIRRFLIALRIPQRFAQAFHHGMFGIVRTAF
jgi:hypothetical protein